MKWKTKVISKLLIFFSKKEDVTVDDVRDIWYVERSNNILAVDYFLSYFIRVVVKKKLKSLMFFLLSCNDNNYMTYCWPNSAFFNFQNLLIKGNCRQYSCILLLTNWNKRAHVQKGKRIYLSIYLSIWTRCWKQAYVWSRLYICMFYQGDDTAAFGHSWYGSQTM